MVTPLKPQGRGYPRCLATFAELFDKVAATPITYKREPGPGQGWLFLHTWQATGISTNCLYYVRFTPAFVSMLAPSIYSNHPDELHREMSIELLDDGPDHLKVYVSFQGITGAYYMAQVTRAEIKQVLGLQPE